jgi:hypothetical protein
MPLTNRYANHRQRVELWRQKTKDYQFFAVCSMSLRPEKVDTEHVGHFVSLSLQPGLMAYAFTTQQFRDRFITKYRPHGARACGDPANA